MAIIARLTTTDLLSDVEFDEVTESKFSIDNSAVFAGEYDEVTNITLPMRYFANGTVIVSGIFNEVDGIDGGV